MRKVQVANGMSTDDKDIAIYSMEKRIKYLLLTVTITILLVLVAVALAAATLGIVNKRLKETTTTTTITSTSNIINHKIPTIISKTKQLIKSINDQIKTSSNQTIISLKITFKTIQINTIQ